MFSRGRNFLPEVSQVKRDGHFGAAVGGVIDLRRPRAAHQRAVDREADPLVLFGGVAAGVG